MSSSKELYKRFLGLCQKWPLDETKVGRDYGEYFRAQLAKRFPHGELGKVESPKSTELYISALERIVSNKYYNENSLKRSSASGMEAEFCKDAVSNLNLEALQKMEEQTMIEKLKRVLSFKFVDSK